MGIIIIRNTQLYRRVQNLEYQTTSKQADKKHTKRSKLLSVPFAFDPIPLNLKFTSYVPNARTAVH